MIKVSNEGKSNNANVLLAEVLTGMYVCICNQDGKIAVDYTTLSGMRRTAINKLLTDTKMDWQTAVKYGWMCIKVNVSFEHFR